LKLVSSLTLENMGIAYGLLYMVSIPRFSFAHGYVLSVGLPLMLILRAYSETYLKPLQSRAKTWFPNKL